MLTPSDGMQISASVRLTPGVYYLPNGLTVAADNISIDGSGALLVGAGRRGSGIRLEGRRGVTIRNLRLAEYYHGISARNCVGLSISECSIGATHEEPPNTLFLDIWRPADQAYGSGIFLDHVSDSQISANDLQHQQNGLLCYHCERLTISRNHAGYNSGFGMHLFATSDSLIEANHADYCCRYHPRGGGGHLGADAAGFLIAHNSCRNIFRRNNARMGGDGFFLAGLRPDWVHVPCNDNLFEENDGSYSPNIAFEATFSAGNRFVRNRAYGCNYGFWLGFSRDTVVEENSIAACRRGGIAVENGIAMGVHANRFEENRYGILLWSRYVAAFAAAVPANDTSHSWEIRHNRFTTNEVAIRLAADQDHGIRPLPALSPRCPRPHHHTITDNQFQRNHLDIEIIDADEPQGA